MFDSVARSGGLSRRVISHDWRKGGWKGGTRPGNSEEFSSSLIFLRLGQIHSLQRQGMLWELAGVRFLIPDQCTKEGHGSKS